MTVLSRLTGRGAINRSDRPQSFAGTAAAKLPELGATVWGLAHPPPRWQEPVLLTLSNEQGPISVLEL